MCITLPALIFIVILLTWSPERIDDAFWGLFRLALWLVGAVLAVLAVLALVVIGKLLLANPALAIFLGTMLLGLVVAFCKFLLEQPRSLFKSRAEADAHWDAVRKRASLEVVPAVPTPIYRDSDFEAWRKSR